MTASYTPEHGGGFKPGDIWLDGKPWIDPGSKAEEPPATAKLHIVAETAEPAAPFKGLTHADVLDLQFEDESDLVDGIVECGVVGIVAGLPETYKSWLAQAIAIGVSAGEGEILGRGIRQQGPSGYFWQDDSRRNEAERVQTYARAHATPRDLPITWFLNVGLTLPDDIARLRVTVEEFGLVLVVIDSFYNVAAGDLKDRDAGRIIARLKNEVSDPTGCTVLVIDHMPWATDSNRSRLRAYGDVFKGAAARFGVYIDVEGEKLRVEARGNNIRGLPRTPVYWDADTLSLRLVDTTAENANESEDALDAVVVAWLREQASPRSQTKVRRGVKRRHENVDQALERLKGRGEVRDSARNGGAWSGQPGTPRYWEATTHADSTPPQQNGAGSGEVVSQARKEPTPPGSPRPLKGGEVGAGQGSGGTPLPADDTFPDLADDHYQHGHITEAEWLERRKLHAHLIRQAVA
jgi:AAA domain